MLLGGLGVFLVGIKFMGDNLENIAGNKMKTLFNKISNNRFSGVAIGAAVTAVIQSSSATTVMVIGFVNAGVMTLVQATSIIMGANIGTTVTAQIVALKSLPITEVFIFLACIGAFMQMSKKDVIKKVGAILSGIGILFVGLTVMSDSMEVLKDNPAIREVLLNTSNPFLLLIFGTALTAVIQSSSATTTIVISLAGSGLMTLRSAIFTTLGINIGTCVTALLASIGATTNAKRTSVIHLSFNVIGCALFFTIFMCLPQAFFTTMEGWFNGVIETQIAMFHTFFNVVTTILLLPFVKQLPKLASLIVRDKKSKVPATVEDDTTKKLTYIDNRLVATPSIAIMMARKEIIGMFELAKKNLDMSVDMITTLDLSSKENFENREIKIDYLNAETTKFLIKISTERISYINEKELASYYHALSDIERVGDYAENIVEYAQELTNYKTTFSETAIAQIREMNEAINNLYACVHDSFVNRDISTLRLVADLEEVVDRFQEKLERDHIDRMIQNLCPAQAASVFLSLISNMERIADHIRNVFKSMLNYVHAPLPARAMVKQDYRPSVPASSSTPTTQPADSFGGPQPVKPIAIEQVVTAPQPLSEQEQKAKKEADKADEKTKKATANAVEKAKKATDKADDKAKKAVDKADEKAKK